MNEDKWFLDGWCQGARTIREFKHTKKQVEDYFDHIKRAKFGTPHGDAWNLGRKDACSVALGLDA